MDLGPVRPVSLVVYRTPFPLTDTRVELSTDGVNFHRVGSTPGGSPAGGLYPVHVEPSISVRLAWVRSDRFGFSGAVLDELSAW